MAEVVHSYGRNQMGVYLFAWKLGFGCRQYGSLLQQITPYEQGVPLFIAMGSGNEMNKPMVINQTYEFGTMSNFVIQF